MTSKQYGFYMCHCGAVIRSKNQYMKHRKTTKGHTEEDDAVARVFRCNSLTCDETTRLYEHYSEFFEDHKQCLRSKHGIESQSAVKTKVLLLEKRRKRPHFGNLDRGKQNV